MVDPVTMFKDGGAFMYVILIVGVFAMAIAYERLFYIVALAFIFLTAHGAAAEDEGFDKGCKANTCKLRVLNLLRLGHIFIRQCGAQFEYALLAFKRLAALDRAPNWG